MEHQGEVDQGTGQGGWAGCWGMLLGAVGYSIQETLNILLAVLHPALLPDDPGRVITEVATFVWVGPQQGRSLLRGGASVGDNDCSRT